MNPSVFLNQPFPDPKMLARKARMFPMQRSREINTDGNLLGNNQPIIMISSSPTALITMHNVKRFLEEATYVHFVLVLLIIRG